MKTITLLATIAVTSLLTSASALADNGLHNPSARLASAANSLQATFVEELKEDGEWPPCDHNRPLYNAIVSFNKAASALHNAIDDGETCTCTLRPLAARVKSTASRVESLADDAHLCSCVEDKIEVALERAETMEEAFDEYAEHQEDEESYEEAHHDHGDHHHENRLEFGTSNFRISLPLGE